MIADPDANTQAFCLSSSTSRPSSLCEPNNNLAIAILFQRDLATILRGDGRRDRGAPQETRVCDHDMGLEQEEATDDEEKQEEETEEADEEEEEVTQKK